MREKDFENLQRAVRLIEEAKSCIAKKDYIKAEGIAGKILECEVAGYRFYATLADIYRKMGDDGMVEEMTAKLVNEYKKLQK